MLFDLDFPGFLPQPSSLWSTACTKHPICSWLSTRWSSEDGSSQLITLWRTRYKYLESPERGSTAPGPPRTCKWGQRRLRGPAVTTVSPRLLQKSSGLPDQDRRPASSPLQLPRGSPQGPSGGSQMQMASPSGEEGSDPCWGRSSAWSQKMRSCPLLTGGILSVSNLEGQKE